MHKANGQKGKPWHMNPKCVWIARPAESVLARDSDGDTAHAPGQACSWQSGCGLSKCTVLTQGGLCICLVTSDSQDLHVAEAQ